MTVWKVSGQSGKFLDSLESFWTVWKVSGQSGNFLDSLESFRTVWKASGQSGKFPDSLESFRTVWKVSGQSGKFPNSLEFFDRFQIVCNNFRTFVYVVKRIYALLAHMSRKKFTHIVRKVFARQSLPTGKLRHFRALLSSYMSKRMQNHTLLQMKNS